MNVYAKQKQTHRHRKQSHGTNGERGEGRRRQGYGINRCKILYIKQTHGTNGERGEGEEKVGVWDQQM